MKTLTGSNISERSSSVIDWRKVWREFDKWVELDRTSRCDKCGHKDSDYPDWPDQAKKILSLVEAQLKKKPKKR